MKPQTSPCKECNNRAGSMLSGRTGKKIFRKKIGKTGPIVRGISRGVEVIE